jgi:hypothetical protein
LTNVSIAYILIILCILILFMYVYLLAFLFAVLSMFGASTHVLAQDTGFVDKLDCTVSVADYQDYINLTMDYQQFLAQQDYAQASSWLWFIKDFVLTHCGQDSQSFVRVLPDMASWTCNDFLSTFLSRYRSNTLLGNFSIADELRNQLNTILSTGDCQQDSFSDVVSADVSVLYDFAADREAQLLWLTSIDSSSVIIGTGNNICYQDNVQNLRDQISKTTSSDLFSSLYTNIDSFVSSSILNVSTYQEVSLLQVIRQLFASDYILVNAPLSRASNTFINLYATMLGHLVDAINGGTQSTTLYTVSDILGLMQIGHIYQSAWDEIVRVDTYDQYVLPLVKVLSPAEYVLDPQLNSWSVSGDSSYHIFHYTYGTSAVSIHMPRLIGEELERDGVMYLVPYSVLAGLFIDDTQIGAVDIRVTQDSSDDTIWYADILVQIWDFLIQADIVRTDISDDQYMYDITMQLDGPSVCGLVLTSTVTTAKDVMPTELYDFDSVDAEVSFGKGLWKYTIDDMNSYNSWLLSVSGVSNPASLSSLNDILDFTFWYNEDLKWDMVYRQVTSGGILQTILYYVIKDSDIEIMYSIPSDVWTRVARFFDLDPVDDLRAVLNWLLARDSSIYTILEDKWLVVSCVLGDDSIFQNYYYIPMYDAMYSSVCNTDRVVDCSNYDVIIQWRGFYETQTIGKDSQCANLLTPVVQDESVSSDQVLDTPTTDTTSTSWDQSWDESSGGRWDESSGGRWDESSGGRWDESSGGRWDESSGGRWDESSGGRWDESSGGRWDEGSW